MAASNLGCMMAVLGRGVRLPSRPRSFSAHGKAKRIPDPWTPSIVEFSCFTRTRREVSATPWPSSNGGQSPIGHDWGMRIPTGVQM